MGSLEGYSIRQEAARIFHEVLLRDGRLQIPAEVALIAQKTSFDDTDTMDTPYLPVPYKFTESSAALWALAATFGNLIAQDRFGVEQGVRVNTDVASLFLMSAGLAKVDGKGLNDPSIASRYLRYDLGRSFDPYRRLCTNVYRTRDRRFFHLHGSMNADKSLTMVNLPLERESIGTYADFVFTYALRMIELDSDWLDVEANLHWRQAGTVCLTEDEFRASPQGQAIRDDSIYTITPFDQDTIPPVPYPEVNGPGFRPLEGLRVLDISRVIAAPTIGKLAALFGATVIRVSCTSQPDMGPILLEGNLGKRDVSIDLKSREGRKTLCDLLETTDVVIDGYRPGALERLGFGDAYLRTIAKRRGKGIVVIRENCYGWKGPWATRSGWQRISDCFTGVAWGMGEFLGLNEPVVPLLPKSDYQTGLAGIIGILSAIHQRSKIGGSYNVDVSLTQFNQFLLGLGKHSAQVQQHLKNLHPDLNVRHYDDMLSLTEKFMRTAYGNTPRLFNSKYFDETPSRFNGLEGQTETLTYVGPAATYDVTKLHYDIGSCFLDTYPPEWPADAFERK
ncbi:CAIB BAIF family enzyme [Fusarium tjaetaba]|uniref:CAIB BAIF family enzyme n=1 Tax=Fusarium tjaetaba TaxID=1567544 RepID=A0A8H5R4E6_9HYPO|nr:CAIB BAIF family enzyme [Fusarium tjaetaba]KAF5625191.1 CAIB BAIF family enzyme [Fusarium tjaetaba]